MTVDAVGKLIATLDHHIEERDLGKPLFRDPRYSRAFPIVKERFRPITPTESERRFVFVDGGNQEILGAPNFSVQLNRVYYSAFKGQTRIHENALPDRIDFFSAVHSCFRKGKLFYDTSIVPLASECEDLLPDEADLSFDSFDRTVMVGLQRADVSRIASIARKFAEWEYAVHLVQKAMKPGDVLVLDGTLQTTYTNEFIYAKKLYTAAKAKNIIVTGLSKTSRLFTTTGLSLLGAVAKFAADHEIPYQAWALPVAEVSSTDHNAFIFVVKLSDMASHIFRFEIYGEQYRSMKPEIVNEILSQLAENARDVSFPGYPYGLINADRFARVSGEDAEGYQVLLLSEISKQGRWPKFARHIRATDAHTILNMLMG